MIPDGLYFYELKQKENKDEFEKVCIKEYDRIRMILTGLMICIFVLTIIASCLK